MSENKEDAKSHGDSEEDRTVTLCASILNKLFEDLKKNGDLLDCDEQDSDNTPAVPASDHPVDEAQKDVDDDVYLYGEETNELEPQIQTEAANSLLEISQTPSTSNTNSEEKVQLSNLNNDPQRKMLLEILLGDEKEEKFDYVLNQLEKMFNEDDTTAVEQEKLQNELHSTGHQEFIPIGNEDGSLNAAAHSSDLVSIFQVLTEFKQTNSINEEKIMKMVKKATKKYTKEELKKMIEKNRIRNSSPKIRKNDSSVVKTSKKLRHSHHTSTRHSSSSSDRSSPHRKMRQSSSCNSRHKSRKNDSLNIRESKYQKTEKSRRSRNSSRTNRSSSDRSSSPLRKKRRSLSSDSSYGKNKPLKIKKRSKCSSSYEYSSKNKYLRKRDRSRSRSLSSSSFDSHGKPRREKSRKVSRSRSPASVNMQSRRTSDNCVNTPSCPTSNRLQSNHFLTSSTSVTQKTCLEVVQDDYSIIERTITTSYTEELQSLKQCLQNKDCGSQVKRDDSLERIDLVVRDHKNADVTANRPYGDLDHPFYIHPEDIELYKERMSNGTQPVLCLHELCVKYKWNFPTYLLLPPETHRFRFGMKLKDHEFSTNQGGQQKKSAKVELAKAVLQWLRIIDV